MLLGCIISFDVEQNKRGHQSRKQKNLKNESEQFVGRSIDKFAD